jgi:hypothetical protein
VQQTLDDEEDLLIVRPPILSNDSWAFLAVGAFCWWLWVYAGFLISV